MMQPMRRLMIVLLMVLALPARMAWADVMPGSNLGEPVVADGKRLSQIQFDIALAWKADADGVYHPTPAPYELVVDGLSFY